MVMRSGKTISEKNLTRSDWQNISKEKKNYTTH